MGEGRDPAWTLKRDFYERDPASGNRLILSSQLVDAAVRA